jgi:predicted RNA-binding Zn-ribbon protein involved in translation (DUF1610 family)
MLFAHIDLMRQVYAVAIFAESLLVAHAAPRVVTAGFGGMHDICPFCGAVIDGLRIKSCRMTSTAFTGHFSGFSYAVTAKTRDHFRIIRIFR